jgi:hypothetical protein
MTSPRIRVQFAHGLESSPQGNKARLFAAHFEACTPAMGTHDFEACIAVHADALARFRPDLLVGSSFGGAVAVELMQRGLWRGPSLLLAQAALYYLPNARLPAGARVTLVHARQDEIVPFAHSEQLAASAGIPADGSARNGERERLVELIACDDDHALSALVTSGALVALVARAAAPYVPAEAFPPVPRLPTG